MNKKPLIILTGPTAVGKTALSVLLAKEIDGEIISADSMQVYKGMDIGSAKIMPYEMEGILEGQIIIDAKTVQPEDYTYVRFNDVTIISDEAYGIMYTTPAEDGFNDKGLKIVQYDYVIGTWDVKVQTVLFWKTWNSHVSGLMNTSTLSDVPK